MLLVLIKKNRFHIGIIICVFLLSFTFEGCKDKQSFVRMPTIAPPVIGISCVEDRNIYRSWTGSPYIILLVWKDGQVIWSKDQLKGGPPYYKGKISSDSVNEFFGALSESELFNKPTRSDYYAPDSSYISIAVINFPDHISLSSWHELIEADPNLVCIDGGAQSLNGRSREEILRNCSKDYQEFIRAWKEIREKATMLIPDGGELIGDASFKYYFYEVESSK